jgi:hypothetical protein
MELGAKILIDIGPVNAESAPTNLPIPALFYSGMKQSVIPGKRHGYAR